MYGKIIKGIGGFYYVHQQEGKKGAIYECKAKGIFRKWNQKPLVGDFVEIEVTDEKEKKGNIRELFERKNELIRPAVANIDQAVLLFSMKKPKPNLNLLDRFLVSMRVKGLDTILCFHKKDIVPKEEIEKMFQVYKDCGSLVLFTSVYEEGGLEELRDALKGKTSTMAGPSGVGKSSVMNCLQSESHMETGAVSERIDRGRHTTRHAEIILIDQETYLIDTPGFSSLHMPDLEAKELRLYYEEFKGMEKDCRFLRCTHTHEPDCGVKKGLEEGKLSPIRYKNYVQLYKELEEINSRKY